jgi:C_GCAxxG_C_C family probable redox protein
MAANNDPADIGAEALALMQNGGLFCAEAVLVALARRQGLAAESVMPLATGFCSGLSRTRGTCGAVSGAVMALGLIHGRRRPADSRDAAYAAVNALIERFGEEFGSINCFELLGCDLGTEEGRQAYRQRQLLPRCHAFTRRAAELAAELSQ